MYHFVFIGYDRRPMSVCLCELSVFTFENSSSLGRKKKKKKSNLQFPRQTAFINKTMSHSMQSTDRAICNKL